MTNPPPIRVCCGERHFGVVCRDQKVMCCLCFSRFAIEDLNVTANGPEDVCKSCAEGERVHAQEG